MALMKPIPSPVITLAQINMLEFVLLAMRAAPSIPNVVPIMTPRLRPILSPVQPKETSTSTYESFNGEEWEKKRWL